MIKILHYHYFDIPNKISTHQFDWNLSSWLMRNTVVTTAEQPYHWLFWLKGASSKNTLEWILKKKVYNPQLNLRLFPYQSPWNSFLYYILELNADCIMSDTTWTKFSSNKHHQLFFLWSVLAPLIRKHLVKGLHSPYCTYTQRSAKLQLLRATAGIDAQHG